MSKVLSFGGSRFVLAGREGDPYYDHLEHHAIGCSEIEIAARILDPDSIVFDVGANIGLTTFAFASIAAEGCVFSFEPIPASFRYLEQNVAANRRGSAKFGRVRPINAACGSSPSVARMYEDSFSAGSFLISSATGDTAPSALEVDIVCVDHLAKEEGLPRLDFVKIDVEGFELDVLAGMQYVLKRYQPVVCLEFNSFCLIANAAVLPSTFLARLCSQFERVAVVTDSGLQLLNNAGDRRAALAANLVQHGSVDSLVCFPTAQQYDAALRRAGRLGLDSRPTYASQPNDLAGVGVELARPFAGQGWSGQAPWGAWSHEQHATVHLDLRGMHGQTLVLQAWAQASPAERPGSKVQVVVNNEPLTTWELGAGMAPHTAQIPASVARRQNPMTIAFNLENAQDVAGTTEPTGIACHRVDISPIGPTI